MSNLSANTQTPKMGRILSGFTCCPVCVIDGRPQEPYMAVPGEYKRVFCHGCGRSSNEFSHGMLTYAQNLPATIRDLVVELTSWTHKDGVEAAVPYRLFNVRKNATSLSSGQAYDGLAGIAARGHVDTLIEESKRETMIFAIDEGNANDAIEICFLPSDAAAFAKTLVSEDAIESQCKQHLASANQPAHRVAAVKKLLSYGFAIKHVDAASSLARILLQSPDGKVKAELHWLNV